MVVQGKCENTVHTLRGGNIPAIEKFVDFISGLLLAIGPVLNHLVSCSVVSFVHIFEKVFDGSNGRGDLDVNVTVELRTQVAVKRHNVAIGKLMTASDNGETIATSLIQWKSTFIEQRLFSVLSRITLRASPILHTGRVGVIRAARSM